MWFSAEGVPIETPLKVPLTEFGCTTQQRPSSILEPEKLI
jgi:hypothetical protein